MAARKMKKAEMDDSAMPMKGKKPMIAVAIMVKPKDEKAKAKSKTKKK